MDTMIFGLVVAPMGWILMLTATVTPQWHEISQRPGFPRDVTISEGLWESCMDAASMQTVVCQPVSEEVAISWPIQMTRALTLLSVLVGLLSYVLTHTGARWWSRQPNYCLTRGSGLLLTLSGVLYLCVTSYMAYRTMVDIANQQSSAKDNYHLGTCLYLGWTGGIAEIFAGTCLMITSHRNRLGGLPLPYSVVY